MKAFSTFLGCSFLILISTYALNAKPLYHYVFFGMDREKIRDASSFFDIRAFEGAQVAYSWRQLETGKDNYDFSLIREDLAVMNADRKKLWIRIQNVCFHKYDALNGALKLVF